MSVQVTRAEAAGIHSAETGIVRPSCRPRTNRAAHSRFPMPSDNSIHCLSPSQPIWSIVTHGRGVAYALLGAPIQRFCGPVISMGRVRMLSHLAVLAGLVERYLNLEHYNLQSRKTLPDSNSTRHYS
jgi:hypothetical protein